MAYKVHIFQSKSRNKRNVLMSVVRENGLELPIRLIQLIIKKTVISQSRIDGESSNKMVDIALK